MPSVKVSGVIIQHEWDDESSTEFKIMSGKFDDTGPWVSVCEDGGDAVYFRPESWDEIRDQIDSMMEGMGDYHVE